jgi:hypothetical protein
VLLQVADCVWDAVVNRRKEVAVGAAFKAAISAYQFTGFNLFG